MAITLENTRFFNARMKEQIEQLKFEQLAREEERQRLRADAAEKYKIQLENFMDMICHEIRNPYAPLPSTLQYYSATLLLTRYLFLGWMEYSGTQI